MKAKTYGATVKVVAMAALALASTFSGSRAQGGPDLFRPSALQAANHLKVAEAYGRLPLTFEVNRGQANQIVQFQARGSNYNLLLTRDSAILVLRGSNGTKSDMTLSRKEKRVQSNDKLLVMRMVGADPHANVEGLDELSGKSNYLIGADPRRWHTNVPNYAKVKYSNVYPGVDLVYYGNQGRLEYDFVVKPDADPRRIMVAVQSTATKSEGTSELRIDSDGDLVAGTDDGAVRFRKPIVYQPIIVNRSVLEDGRPRMTDRRFVDGKYVLKGNHVMFQVAAYDRSKPLVIDPTLVYSTFLGGTSWSNGYAIAVDSSGSAYITGKTLSPNLPATSGAFDSKLGLQGYADGFVAKLNAAGSALVYETYLGGTYDDEGDGIAVDSSGDAYVTGWTSSANFPTTPGTVQTAMGGGFDDAFVTELNPNGSALVYSTYLGGNSHEEGHAIAVDSTGAAYVTGFTYSSTFPTTTGAFETALHGLDDAFVTKLNPGGSALVYSTYLGGQWHEDGRGIAVDASGNVYIAGITDSINFPTTTGAFQTSSGGGYDAFVTKLNSTASRLIYSTYVGGANNDQANGLAVDASGNAYLTGDTFSTNFPVTASAFQTSIGGAGIGHDDAFVSKLNPTGSALVYSTYIGGNGDDIGYGVAVDGSGDAWITGATTSFNFPTTTNAFQTTPGGNDDAFLSNFGPTGSLLYSTYLAGKAQDEGHGITVDSLGNAYVAGWSESTNFPVTTGAFDTIFQGVEAFALKMSAQ